MNSALAIDDLEFTATRVIPPVINEPSIAQRPSVPEPNSGALAALSLMTLGLLLRRARTRRR